MNAHVAKEAVRRVVLLTKSQNFKHSAGFALYGNPPRWHKVGHDKPAPKNAPVASHPHAAGQHAPVVLTDEQIAQLKYPEDKAAANKEMAAHNNVHLPKLLEHAAKGDATAILGTGFGTNSHSKKKALAANVLLGMMGSPHKVELGQAAGSHPAVQQAPEPKTFKEIFPPIDVPAPDKAAEPAPVAKPATPAADKPAIGPVGQALKEAIKEPEAQSPASLAMPSFVEGKTTTGVVDYYAKQAQKVMDLAAAGDAAGLEALKADGLKPKKNGKPSNTWAGKTQNSKLLLALHEQALAQAKGNTTADQPAPAVSAEPVPAPAAPAAEASPAPATSKLSQIPWDSQLLPDSNSNAKSHNKQVGKIKELAEAGDLAGLEALSFGVNTYGKKQEKLKQLAIAALKEDGAAPAPAAAPAPTEPAKPEADQQFEAIADAASKVGYLVIKHPQKGYVLASESGYTKGYANLKQAESAVAKLAAGGLDAHVGSTHPFTVTITGLSAPMDPQASVTPAAPSKPPKPDTSGLLVGSLWPEVIGEAEKAIDKGQKGALEAIITTSDNLDSKGAKLANQYAKDGLAYLKAQDGTAAEDGPNEGDTKQGADGMLVFKNGRWHKQGEPTEAEKAAVLAWLKAPEADEHLHEEGKKLFKGLSKEHQQALTIESLKQQKAEEKANAAEPAPEPAAAQHPIDAVPMPELQSKYPNYQAKLEAGLAKLKEQVKAEGASALKGITKTMSASGKLITKLPSEYGQLKVVGSVHYPDHVGSKVHAYVEALKAAAGKPPKKPKAAPTATAAPHADQNAIESMDSWQQTGPQGGSNPGGKFKDQDGVEWYCKFPGDEDVAKSEVLAAKLYEALGIAGQDAKLITKGGKLGIASKWQEVKKASSPAELAKVDGVASGFAADAWLGNWDVVGLGYDNLQIGADGKAMRVDAGGSLQYRAQGGKKDFGNVVGEIDSLRDPKINPQAAAVFGKLSQADITAGVAKVLKISDAQIYALVNTYGPGDAAHKKALAETLIARKADLLAKFPKAKKDKKATFKPEKISEPPSFMNWGGSGKDGPSSKPFLNKANEEAVQAIYAAAKTGSIEAIQKLEADVYNKETGAVTGKAPVLSHPSQHVKGYAQQAVNEINYQMNPPKRFRFEGGHPLATLNSAYPAHKGPPHSAAVEKAGKFLVLGEPGKISLESLALPKVTYASGALTRATYSPAAKAAIGNMPETQKQAIAQYTGAAYKNMNTSLWGGNPSGAAKAAAEALHTNSHDIAPGTVLSRKLTVHGSGLDEILKSTGKVLQEPAIMSTSIRPSSWSGNVHLKLHVGPGVKGLWVGVGSKGPGSALSVNAPEDELILPPNTRIMVLSVKPSNGGDADGFGVGPTHIVEAIVLPTQSHA